MALIWRRIFDVDDGSFAANAKTHIESWLRWKLRENAVEIPLDGTLVEHQTGCEITGRGASDGDLWGIRAELRLVGTIRSGVETVAPVIGSPDGLTVEIALP